MALRNNLQEKFAAGGLCKAFGIRLVTNPSIVQLAYNAGFDALFIDLEHSNLSIDDASRHSMFATVLGITPFVQVPYQCGNGFVQRVLDGGAMGVVFPHIHNSEDAKAAVAISKYPTLGCRSMTGQLPLFNLKPTPTDKIIQETNARGSTVILMIETKESVQKADEIAAVPGVDVLLIGSNDLAIELGVPGKFQSQEFRTALELVATVCKKHGKVFGLAGIYDAPEIQDWALNTLGARFILGQQDSGILAREGKRNAEALDNIFKG
ncbi:aldolase [Fusarium albosuccineum]|uniref:Aldolase n=1 Tax=Fusarium albosuccineum TaxID=1237068 RepID=A0A8H4LBE0_9HYPO|nr:aldolase [Fusarium albosuccineum]